MIYHFDMIILNCLSEHNLINLADYLLELNMRFAFSSKKCNYIEKCLIVFYFQLIYFYISNHYYQPYIQGNNEIKQ